MDYDEFLRDKKKDELITIARKLQINGFSKLSKGKLREKILTYQNQKGFKSSIGLTKPWYSTWKAFIPLIIGLISILITSHLGLKNKEDIIENQNIHQQELLEIVSPDNPPKGFISEEEYSSRIAKYEKLNRILLQDFYGESFTVFGQKDNHLYRNSKIFDSSIKVDGKMITIKLNMNELPFLYDQLNVLVDDSTRVMPIPGGKLSIGQRFPLNFIIFGNREFWITVLDDNPKAPIFALGLNKARKILHL